MFFIKLSGISKEYIEEKALIRNLNLDISSGNILGIIGRNGEGKTTLLKMILGQESPTKGDIIFSQHDLKIAYHTQFLDLSANDNLSIEDYVLSYFDDLLQINTEIKEISNSLSPDIDRLLELQNQFEENAGYKILSELDKSLIELGLGKYDTQQLIANLSGGEKTRLQLAKVIIQNPDILLLDEPTNHLDTDAIKWLENYVKYRKGITIIVSHDRTFLNNTANRILEIEKGETKLYFGNYDNYKAQKDENVKHQLDVIKDTNKKIKKLQIALNTKKSQAKQDATKTPDKKKYGKFARGGLLIKSGKKARTAKIYSKRVDLQIEKTKSLAPKTYRKMHFKIESADSTGDFVLRIKNLELNIENKILIDNGSLEIMRGQRVAITGENGSGKTTLLKHIINAFNRKDNSGSESCKESILFGGSIAIGYYSQEHEGINLNLNVLDDFRATIPMFEEDASNYLHNMLFTYEQLRQKTSDLSQGEKSKLALSKLLAKEHNFLVLDEPTNHLDIASREVLEESLNDYKGTILCVSHDKYFLEQIHVDRYYKIEYKKLISVIR